MKIAILTLPLITNYGGIVQNYALQTVLKKMGHEVYTINLNRPKAKLQLKNAPYVLIKRLIKIILGRKDGILFQERKVNRDKIIVEQHIDKFIKKHIQLTKYCCTQDDLRKLDNQKFDVVIVGSDQVWRIPYVYPNIETYFLNFIKDRHTKKIAYSASFGTDEKEFSDKQIKKCGELIKQFETVTVREDSGLDLINKYYHWTCKTPPVHTLDPTMLLSKEDYINISSEYEDQIDGELFYYVLDMTEDKEKVLEQIAKDLDYKPFTVASKSNNWFDNPNDRIVPPIELWLQAFNKAKYVFTDSFHGCVFSIIFNKDFIVYGNNKRGMSRFDSLLNMFSLKDRFIINSNKYNNQLINNHINWDDINKKIELQKTNSLKYLVNFHL